MPYTPWGGCKLLPEQHNLKLDTEINIPANTSNQFISLGQFNTVSFILMQITGATITYSKNSSTNTTMSCRAIAVETPNAEVITGLYVSTPTGTTGTTLKLLVLGD